MPGDQALERSVLFVTALTSFLGPFMVSSVNVALPAIQADFGMDAVQLSWMATAYLLATAMFLIPAGRLADIHGRKKVFTIGLIIYTLASALALLAPSGAWLIAARFLQGSGAALFVTTGMAIITSVFPPERRGKIIGIYVSAVYVGLSVGPFVGGVITQRWGWRYLFILMLPLGSAMILISHRFLRGEWADARGQKLDVAGSLIYGAAIASLVYGATHLPTGQGYLLLSAAAVGLVLFIWRQKQTPQPVFDVTLFQTNRTFAFSSLAALINYAATFAIAFLLSLFLQYLKGLTPQAAGMLLAAQPVTMAICSPLAGRLSDRIEPRLLASAGMSITALGLAAFAMLDATTPAGLIVANLIWLGVGFALFSSPNMSAIMGSVERRHFGIAAGAASTMRLLGQMLSMAVAATVLAIFIGRQAIQPHNYALFLKSTQTVFGIFSALCLMGVYFSMFRGKLRA
jgi:EmrB/QacA subfamily drug resistance transporter